MTYMLKSMFYSKPLFKQPNFLNLALRSQPANPGGK